MRKSKITVLCAVLASSVFYSSCIGSFPVFNKMLSWNKGVSDSKFLNELVFVCLHIIPVYEVCYLADGLVFNSIEFWTGNNPIAKVGETKRMKGSNGDVFAITNTEDGYRIVDETKGVECQLLFDKKAKTWSAKIGENIYELMTLNEDGTVTMNLRDGHTLTVPLDETGVELAYSVAGMNNGAFDMAQK